MTGDYFTVEYFIGMYFNTGPYPGLPEITLHTLSPFALETLEIETKPAWPRELTSCGRINVGGFSLARYILDHPEEVRGKRVVDVCSGSGVSAIAEDIAGAQKVTAVERDWVQTEILKSNASKNGRSINVLHQDASEISYADADVIVAGDALLEAPNLAEVLLREYHAGKSILLAGHTANDASNQLAAFGSPLVPNKSRLAYFFKLTAQS